MVLGALPDKPMHAMTRALVIAAPHSGAGKTTITLALLRALRNAGHNVAGAKSGPDYIDPAFHTAATGRPALNLDAWAMDTASLRARAITNTDLLIIEGAMGALDGAGQSGKGSAADLAETLGAPILMVQDASHSAQSAALSAAGLRALRPEIPIAGVILNNTRSPRHARMATAGLKAADIPHLGTLPHTVGLKLPDRHLGLVQAIEHPTLETFLEAASTEISKTCDLEAIAKAAAPLPQPGPLKRMPPLGQRIAVAEDAAFAFAYPHLLADWQAQGASLHPFSPLANAEPDPSADAIFLPGGYPELHAGPLAAAHIFRHALQNTSARIYGECGGYMVLGDALTDAAGTAHRMLGLLPLHTSFAIRRLSLGYRNLTPQGGPFSSPLNGHEFHYATILEEGAAPPLFTAEDADGNDLGKMGLALGNVSGSFAHIIAPR